MKKKLRYKMEKTTFKLKNFQSFNEDIAQHAYAETTKAEEKEAVVTKEEPSKNETEATDKPEKEKEAFAPVKAEEEESSTLNKTLEKCIENVEEIVGMFEKNDKKLIDLVLPILDLCQSNLNFQEKKVEGKDYLLETSKKIIKSLVEKLKKDYANNDPVTELVENCNKI